MIRSISLFAGLAALAPAPAAADLPPPSPMYAWYGPVRHCADGYALEAKAGEALIVTGRVEAGLRVGRHTLLVNRVSSAYASGSPLIRPAGTLDLPGVGTLARFGVSAGQPGDARVTYLYTPPGGTEPLWEIASDLFTGTARDRAVLARVALGEQARTLCAAVPDALKPDPARANPEAWLMRERRYPGPLTVCWAGMAMDVATGESAILPWQPDMHRFALIASGLEVGVAGDFRSGTNPTGVISAQAAGPLLPFHTLFTLGTATRYGGLGNQYMRAGVPVTNVARLLSNADIRAIGPDPGPGVTFSFSRPVADAERDALIGRVRAGHPSDRCFDPEA